MKVLYDTSVLVAALLVNHPNHALAFPKLEMVQRRVVHGYLSTHSLAELYSVLTRLPQPLRVFPDEAQTATLAVSAEQRADLITYFEAVPLLVEDYQSAN